MDPEPPHPADPARRLEGAPPTPRPSWNGRGHARTSWQRWARAIEVKRRRTQNGNPARFYCSRPVLARSAYASFRLEGMEIDEAQVLAAIAVGSERRAFRTRQAQRVRNHVAIQLHIARKLRSREALLPAAVVRWYTSISCGLCPGELADGAHDRLATLLHRINAPELRLRAALHDIARLHVQLMNEPLVPSFNGILARLLLHYHLGRCGFPLVLFDPATPAATLRQGKTFLPLLMQLIEQSYA